MLILFWIFQSNFKNFIYVNWVMNEIIYELVIGEYNFQIIITIESHSQNIAIKCGILNLIQYNLEEIW